MSSCDVLIIGAGPTGLAAALEGQRLGLNVRIVDKIAIRSDKSRALVLHARSLEFLQKLGLIETFIERGTKTVGAVFNVEGRKVAEANLGPVGKEETPFPYVLFLSQAETEEIMEDALAKRGVKVEYQTSLAELKQDGSGVTAVLRSPHGEELVRCHHLVGADGAHSAVRHALGVTFAGAPYAQDFILCDAHVSAPFEPLKLNIFLGKVGVLVFFPLEGAHISRAILARPEHMSLQTEPTPEECEAAMSTYIGAPVRIDDVRWIARFRLHHRVASRYVVGRVALAGDAAHIHSPAGGQGMNTGIQDSWNLMWKIAAVIREQANPTLLETYHLERQRVGIFLLKRTDRFFQLAATNNRLATRLRNTLIPLALKLGGIFASTLGLTLFRMLSQIGIRYRLSPLSQENRAHVPRHAPRAGWRAPDAPLSAAGVNTTLFEITRDPVFHLLVYGERFNAEEEKRWNAFAGDEPLPLNMILIAAQASDAGWVDSQGTFARRYGLQGPAMVLLRPDGHIALACDGHDDIQVATYLAKIKDGSFFDIHD